jgi:glycosidase
VTSPIEKSLLDIDFASLTQRTFTPSPAAWEDQVLYFLLLDRFSDGKEKDGYRDEADRPVQGGSTPLFRAEDSGRVDYDVWFRAGGGWQGGTLKGLKSKLGYLRRLGITALWVSPIFRQVAFEPSYHGYGIQNFLDVDPHFGTREEFRDFVRAAHEQGMYVILHIIAHHAGNVFTHAPDRYTTHDPASGQWYNDPRWDGRPYAVQGFNDRDGRATLPFDTLDDTRMEAAWPDGAIWPREFQRADLFLRKGHITSWDYYPEYAEGDMFSLKTLDLWVRWDGQYRQASSALACLALTYCFWIAYADLDGFRIDAAKHMGEEALRTRIDASATPEQKKRLAQVSPEAIKTAKLAGEPITSKLTRAPGNKAPIGGLKVVAENGWFAARPSGTENIYKIYAESFRGQVHLDSLVAEAQEIVDDALAG